MSWCAIDVRSQADLRDRVAAWLVTRTGQAVEECADGTLVGFAADAGEAGTLLAGMQASFGAAVAAAPREVPEVDWRLRWRDGLGPRRIGRLTISPSWTAGAAGDGPLLILDPETAFGSGEHGSTRSVLVLLDALLAPGDRVLDLGSGSGILALAALRFGARRATGVDLDPEAEPVARRNAERNGLAGLAEFLTGDAAVLGPLLGPVELLTANILRSGNEALLGPIRTALVPGGRALFGGMEAPEQPGFLAALAAAGYAPVAEVVDSGWWAVAARPE
jgi:ribosomal protein L11 methyltransferase